MTNKIRLKFVEKKGGAGSGHHGHAGRPGKVGGSSSGKGVGSVGEFSNMTEDEMIKNVGQGDLVKSYNGNILFVADQEYSDKYWWVTDDVSERMNRHASGWSMYKTDIVDLIPSDVIDSVMDDPPYENFDIMNIFDELTPDDLDM
jgi:hypothetical protein